MKRIALLALVAGLVAMGGCGSDKKNAKPDPVQPPRAVVKRLPCKIRFGPLAAALEVDLSEIRNLALDAGQLYREVVHGEPSSIPPAQESPVIMVVNKKG